MLVDIDHLTFEQRLGPDHRRYRLLEEDQPHLAIERLQLGVYTAPNFRHNFEHCVDGILVNYKHVHFHRDPWGWESKDFEARSDMLSAFGIADNIEQVLEHFREEVADPTRSYVISVDEVRRDEQEAKGGWRWHKWGEYIGTQTPTCEYIYDEPWIERVYCFQIYEVHLPVRCNAATS